jgi:hypothetical protein
MRPTSICSNNREIPCIFCASPGLGLRACQIPAQDGGGRVYFWTLGIPGVDFFTCKS